MFLSDTVERFIIIKKLYCYRRVKKKHTDTASYGAWWLITYTYPAFTIVMAHLRRLPFLLIKLFLHSSAIRYASGARVMIFNLTKLQRIIKYRIYL
jgi:hypothetical protein